VGTTLPRETQYREPAQVQALIAGRTRPSLTCEVGFVYLDGKLIIAVRVPLADRPVGTASGRYLRRAIGGRGTPECLPYHFHEMQAFLAARGVLDYTALPIPEVSWNDLDPLEFERFRRFIRESRGQGDAALLELTDVELAKSLGAVEANHEPHTIRVLALLLFGREESIRRHLPTHEVAFQVLSGVRVEANEFFRYPLLRLMDELMLRFRARNRERAELLVGAARIGIPDYSERAFREAVANALVHRDYTRYGAVHIQWHPNRIEVSNPGGLPEGVRLDNLLVAPPRPRNPLLADAFKRAGIVERTARGVDIMFYEQLRYGRPAPNYARTSPTDVIVELYNGEAQLPLVRYLVEQEHAGEPLSLDELILLQLTIERGVITLDEAARAIQKTHEAASEALEQLQRRRLLAPSPHARARYQLSPYAQQTLEQAAALPYADLQQRILDYLQDHESISRQQAAEICNLSPHQAYRLLNRMVQSGVLEASPTRGRGAH
jgi:ATP-dependent DNA helicase RecG